MGELQEEVYHLRVTVTLQVIQKITVYKAILQAILDSLHSNNYHSNSNMEEYMVVGVAIILHQM
jgi:hypothetical protein